MLKLGLPRCLLRQATAAYAPLRHKQAAPAFLLSLNLLKHKHFQRWKLVFTLPAGPWAR